MNKVGSNWVEFGKNSTSFIVDFAMADEATIGLRFFLVPTQQMLPLYKFHNINDASNASFYVR